MSVLGLMENTADIAQTTPDLSALPSTNTERMGAAWDAAQTPDRFWNVDNARAKRADKIIDDLHAMTGERLLNPYGIGNTPTADEVRENVGQPMSVIYAKRLEKLRVATRNAKAGIEQLGGLPDDYLDVDSIDASIGQASGEARARDERMSGTGGGAGGFIGAMAGETVSPAGLATLFIPVTGGIGTTVARATIGAFAKNVAREALFQGGTQAAAQFFRPSSTTRHASNSAPSRQTSRSSRRSSRREPAAPCWAASSGRLTSASSSWRAGASKYRRPCSMPPG